MTRLKFMRLALPVTLFYLVSFAPFINAANSADDPGNFFNPPATTNQDLDFDTTFQLGGNITVKWTTSIDNFTIAFYQNTPGVRAVKGKTPVYASSDGNTSQFSWKVQLYEFSLETSPVFFFWLGEGSLADVGTSSGFTSAYFNITKAVVSSSATSTTTTAAASTSTTPTTSTSASAVLQIGTASTSPTQTPVPSSSSSSSLSTGAIVGIVIALIAVLGGGAAAAYFLFRRHKNKKASAAATAAALETNDYDRKSPPANGAEGQYAPVPNYPQEMEVANNGRNALAQSEPAELEMGHHVSELGGDSHMRAPMELP